MEKNLSPLFQYSISAWLILSASHFPPTLESQMSAQEILELGRFEKLIVRPESFRRGERCEESSTAVDESVGCGVLVVVHSYVWPSGKLVDDDQKVAPVVFAYVCMDKLKWSRCWMVRAERLCWL
ncbi:hypothetical protein OUZ56_009878 [Daphnia magna]|uniref:Uncharacterized protein n=1 Tax=Daphnia magna TaxID=35525 RepID=A0ABR0AH43_9CRUS|nr:hypothetical protein OUZ56_009878 [Daphnia magna]